MKRFAVLLALGACSSSGRSDGERAPVPPPTTPAASAQQQQQAPAQQPAQPQAVQAAQPLSDHEVVERLQAVGRRRGAELRKAAEWPEDEIRALGPCQRPGADERAALRARVLAWIEKTTAASEYPAEQPEQLSLRFGCVEPAGIVIAAQMDRETKQGKRTHAVDLGHWWTLRVTPAAIAALSETRGLATMRYGSRTDNEWQATLALADLDGDGALDPIVARFRRQGVAIGAKVQLSVVGSRTGRPKVLESFGDDVELSRVQPGDRRGPVVLELVDRVNNLRAFRCVGAAPALVRCLEAEVSRRGAEAVAIAERLAGLREVPDRAGLAAWLDLVGVSEAEAEPLLAAASPTTAADRAARKIERFLRQGEDRTRAEHEAAVRRESAAARERRLEARATLSAATPQALSDPAKRAPILRALERLGAEPAFVIEISRLP